MRKLITMREALRRPEYFGDVLAADLIWIFARHYL